MAARSQSSTLTANGTSTKPGTLAVSCFCAANYGASWAEDDFFTPAAALNERQYAADRRAARHGRYATQRD